MIVALTSHGDLLHVPSTGLLGLTHRASDPLASGFCASRSTAERNRCRHLRFIPTRTFF